MGRLYRATFTTLALMTASFAPLGLTRSQREALAKALARSVRVEWRLEEVPYEATTTTYIFVGIDGSPLIAAPVSVLPTGAA